MSRLQTITFLTDTGGEQTLTVQDYSEEEQIVFWNQPSTQALDGSLRQNTRALRLSFNLKYELCNTPSDFMDIANNIAEDMRNGQEWFYVGIDNSNLFRVVLDGDFVHKVEYANQHGLFIPKMNMKAYALGPIGQINIIVKDYRFITEAVDKAEDWGLITESVTEQRDYGVTT